MGNLVTETPFSEVTATLEILSEHGVGRKQLYRLRRDPGFAEQVAKTLLGGFCTKQPFEIFVDYRKSIEEMIKAGNFTDISQDVTAENFDIDWKAKHFAKHFGTLFEKSTWVRLELVHFDRAMETSEVLAKLDELVLRPANIIELLTFSDRYPLMQLERHIVALGSTWRNHCGAEGAPCLGGTRPDKRFLCLEWLANNWQRYHHFAAVEKTAL